MSGGGINLGPIDEVFNEIWKGGIVNPVKEITGAAAAEEANAIARQQFEESKIQADKARKEAQSAKQISQTAASNAAGGARNVGAPKKTNTVTPVGDVKDYLGV